MLVIAAVVDAAFFLSFWGRNAAGLGRHDMGMALSLSFAVPLTFYASLFCASASAAGTAVALVRGRPRGLWVIALAVALLPTAFFLVKDAR